jgi:CubicO group peptidase (beta-lactamase class C family)
LWKLDSDTTWLRSDIDRLETTARRIAQTNSADPFFQNDLQRMSWDMTRYNDTAQRVRSGIKELLTLARKDAGLNAIARDMDWDARSLLNRAQFDIENAAQRLEWAVRGAKPEIIGYNAQWVAMDISRYGRDFTWKVRDISYDTQSLLSKTQP